MTNQQIMDLADQYLYDNGGKNYGIIEFARAIESRTTLTGAGKWFQEGAKIEREACADLLEACEIAAMALAAAAERDSSFQRDYEKVSAALAKARGER